MAKNFSRFLIVDDDVDFTTLLARGLKREGVACDVAHSIEAAKEKCGENDYSHASIDLNMGGESGLHLVSFISEKYPEIETVVLTGYASIATTVDAIKKGASYYLAKPVRAKDVLEIFTTKQDQSSESFIETSQLSDLSVVEWERIQEVLSACDYNISEAARQLGMHRRTLQRKLKKKQFHN